jgi:hypothetical protein
MINLKLLVHIEAIVKKFLARTIVFLELIAELNSIISSALMKGDRPCGKCDLTS